MGRYATKSSEPCVETNKVLKLRLKERKRALKDFIDITRVVDMDWQVRQTTIGNLYMEIRDMKKRLKDFK